MSILAMIVMAKKESVSVLFRLFALTFLPNFMVIFPP
jgi:hypothetical protein